MIDEAACITEISAVLQRHNRCGSHTKDHAYIEYIEGLLTEMAAAADRLRGQANGTIPLDMQPDMPLPETHNLDHDSPSVPPSIPFGAALPSQSEEQFRSAATSDSRNDSKRQLPIAD